MEAEEEPATESFSEDKRIVFIERRLQLLLTLKTDKWSKYIENEDNQKILQDFLEKDGPPFLVFSSTPEGGLTAVHEVPNAIKSKTIYVMKKANAPVGKDKIGKELIFGEFSGGPVEHITTFLEEVVVPVLSNERNRMSWPYFISQDVGHHVDNIKTKTQAVKGLLSGKTLLSIPAVAAKFDLGHNNTDKQDHFARTVLHSLESVVIEWSYQIREVLKLESSLLLLRGLNVGPETELGFWKGRKDNLLCISEQFQSPDVQIMGNILHAKESSYYTTFKTLSKEVEHALVEARDVELHLRPLRQHIELLRETEFPRTHILIPPLFHTICLIWSHSKFYSIPARIIVLLQEFCNLLIDQAIAYLSPEDILKGETEEMLENVQITVNVVKAFKHSFLLHRGKLAKYFINGNTFRPWDFPSHMVFARLDRFLGQLLKIEDIFVTMLEFQKLEKLNFGGNKGNLLNQEVNRLNQEFSESCKVFKESEYDPSDYNNELEGVNAPFIGVPDAATA